MFDYKKYAFRLNDSIIEIENKRDDFIKFI